MKSRIRLRSLRLSLMALSCLLGLQVGCSDSQDDGGPGRPNISVAGDTGFGTEDEDAGDAGDIEECIPQTDEELCVEGAATCGELVVTDNCGVERTIASCGECELPESCGALEANQCACVPQSDEELCDEGAATCGELVVTDNCGVERTIASCGECELPESCGALEANQCACVPQSDEELCDEGAATCGELVVTDNCGVERTIASCGECGAPDTCGELAENLCGCAPQTDAQLCDESGALCGELVATDRCGITRTVASCGVCDGVDTCGELAANQCGCEPQSDAQLCSENAAVCGELVVTDRCGIERSVASCGICDAPDQCGDIAPNQCGCALPSVAELCTEHALECGETQVVDKCGAERVLNCGEESLVCAGEFDTCGGGGTDNICGCTPTTCEENGTLCGQIDDGCGGILTCNYFCVEDLSLGANHACALGSGKAKCWGSNSNGKLGDNSTTQRKEPVDVVGLDIATDIASGTEHTCALTHDGKVICWGDNSQGQLGIGTTVDANKPGLPAITANATQVVTGAQHTCALVNGGVFCWGASGEGQIGNEAITLGSIIGVPMEVTGLSSGVTQLAAGSHHNCALLDDKTVQCWGRGRYGQLGNLEIEPSLSYGAVGHTNEITLKDYSLEKTPVPVAGLPAEIDQVSAGDDFACARTIVGQLWCWGAMTFQNQTCEVEGRRADDCAIFPNAGQGYPVVQYRPTAKSAAAEGENRDDCSAYPNSTLNGERCEWTEYPINKVYIDRAQLVPLQISTTRTNLEVAAGSNHICVRSDEAGATQTNIFCMGRNFSGQLGDGTTNPWTAPRAVHADSDGDAVRAESSTVPHALSLGDNFSCAIVEDNNMQCWGSNQNGQIGNEALLRDESLKPFDVKITY